MLSDAVTLGETCRSISPSSGSTFGRSLRGIGQAAGSVFFIHFPIVNRSPSERIDHAVDIGKIVDQKIWLMFCELLAMPGAGGHGNGACAKGFAASNVARRITDHVDVGGGEFATMFFLCARASEGTKFVAILMIVGKR